MVSVLGTDSGPAAIGDLRAGLTTRFRNAAHSVPPARKTQHSGNIASGRRGIYVCVRCRTASKNPTVDRNMISLFSRLIDGHVERQFGKDPNGRRVFLPSGPKGKCYFVDSKSDEEKIKAFVKMYRSASTLISLLTSPSIVVAVRSWKTMAV